MELRTPVWTEGAALVRRRNRLHPPGGLSRVVGIRPLFGALVRPGLFPVAWIGGAGTISCSSVYGLHLDLDNREDNDRPGRQSGRLGGRTGTEVIAARKEVKPRRIHREGADAPPGRLPDPATLSHGGDRLVLRSSP